MSTISFSGKLIVGGWLIGVALATLGTWMLWQQGFFAQFGWAGLDDEAEQVQCTLEARICPDGSAVGRTWPNCEFAPCPSAGAANSGTGLQAKQPEIVTTGLDQHLRQNDVAIGHSSERVDAQGQRTQAANGVELVLHFPQPVNFLLTEPAVVWNGQLYHIASNVVGGGCYVDPDKVNITGVCHYGDTPLPNGATLRVWYMSSQVMALNPQSLRVGGFWFNNFIITKPTWVDEGESKNLATFSAQEVADWTKVISEATTRTYSRTRSTVPAIPADWKTYQVPNTTISLRYPPSYQLVDDTYGWPRSIILFYDNGQSYELVVEKWTSLADFRRERRRDPDYFTKVADGYITFYNNNQDPVVAQVLSTIEVE